MQFPRGDASPMNGFLERAGGTLDLMRRYLVVLRAAWVDRHHLATPRRSTLERDFLPAALEIVETPAPMLAHAVAAAVMILLSCTLIWAWFGRVDVVSVASGRVIADSRTRPIQPAETAVVRRIAVTDGQVVHAGDILLELEPAGTSAQAEVTRLSEALTDAKLEQARYRVLADLATPHPSASSGALPSVTADAVLATLRTQMERAPAHSMPMDDRRLRAEAQVVVEEWHTHVARLKTLAAEDQRKVLEIAATQRLIQTLRETASIAAREAADYQQLLRARFISEHAYLERERKRVEDEGSLSYQQAKVEELAGARHEITLRARSLSADFARATADALVNTRRKISQLEQELQKAETRQTQHTLRSPVDGTVQQLSVHAAGNVVASAQAVMLLVPADYQAEVEVALENRDIGHVRAGQHAEIKVETFPFTRHGTLPATVQYVAGDATPDPQRGLFYQARLRIDTATANSLARNIRLVPGMAVTAEIITGERRLIDYILDPLTRVTSESMRER